MKRLAGAPTFTAYVDGGARGNPGPGGYGVMIEVEGVGEVYRRAGYLGPTTNNQAEYRALGHCLEVLRELRLRRGVIYSDSELLVKQLAGTYRVKDEGLKPLHRYARERLADLEEVQVRYLPRAENTTADALANLGMDLGEVILEEGDG